VLVWGTKSPESNWAATKLREPALKLGLGGVVWETSHVENLAALRQEGTDISTGIHWSGEDVRVLMWWLGLSNKATQNSSECDSLLHGAPWRRWCQSLKVEWQIMLDWSGRGDWLNFEGSADVGQGGWAEWERLRVVLLPSLVLAAEIESAGVLKVWWKDNSLVAGLAWQLDTQVP
jgi:hypothetical protein